MNYKYLEWEIQCLKSRIVELELKLGMKKKGENK